MNHSTLCPNKLEKNLGLFKIIVIHEHIVAICYECHHATELKPQKSFGWQKILEGETE